jgi:nitrite reductase/ring-hydroxylating ferredoxin subunit
LLAACGGGEDDASSGSTAGGSTAGGGATGGGATGSSSTGDTAGRVAALADVPVGGAIAVSANGQDLLVAQPTEGTVVAYSSKCPHQGCKVGVGDGKFACPCHGAEYELATGAITKDPDPAGNTGDLTTVAVTVQGTDVVTA